MRFAAAVLYLLAGGLMAAALVVAYRDWMAGGGPITLFLTLLFGECGGFGIAYIGQCASNQAQYARNTELTYQYGRNLAQQKEENGRLLVELEDEEARN